MIPVAYLRQLSVGDKLWFQPNSLRSQPGRMVSIKEIGKHYIYFREITMRLALTHHHKNTPGTISVLDSYTHGEFFINEVECLNHERLRQCWKELGDNFRYRMPLYFTAEHYDTIMTVLREAFGKEI